MFDGKAFGENVVEAVTSYLDKKLLELGQKFDSEIASLNARIDIVKNDLAFSVENLSKGAADHTSVYEEIAKQINGLAASVENLPKPRDGIDGKSITIDDVKPFIVEQCASIFKQIPVPVDGKDGTSVTLDDVKPLIELEVTKATEQFTKAINAIPAGPPGKDGINGKDGIDGVNGATLEDLTPYIETVVETQLEIKSGSFEGKLKKYIEDESIKCFAGIPSPKDGVDGKSITLEDVKPFISEEIKKATDVLEIAVKNIPQGADGERGRDGLDGKSVDMTEVKSLIENEVSLAVARIPPPVNGLDGKDGKDGIGVAGIMIDRSGDCIFTLSNGEMKNIGTIQGKDGKDGINGKDGAPGLAGKDGSNGLDGVGWDDMGYEYRDDGLYLIWTKGDVIKEAWVPGLIYKDIWSDEKKDYRVGNLVTWAGSLWIAKCDNPTGSPKAQGEGGRDWKLVAKKGRDGRDGRNGKDFTKPVKLEEDK